MDTFCPFSEHNYCSSFCDIFTLKEGLIFAKNTISSVTETWPSFCHVFTADCSGLRETCGHCNLCPTAMRTYALSHYQAKRPGRLRFFCHFLSILAKNFLYILFQLHSHNLLWLLFIFFSFCTAALSFCPLIHLSIALFSFCLQYHQWVCVASESRAQAVPHEGAHSVTHGKSIVPFPSTGRKIIFTINSVASLSFELILAAFA